jgi:hypothetical protein
MNKHLQFNLLQSSSYLLLCSWLFIACSSCFAPRYRLSQQERAFIANNAKFGHISIRYDNKAIRRLDSNGIYKVECNERRVSPLPTEPEALAKAIAIANALLPVVNFKEHHQYIHIELTGDDDSPNLYGSARQYRCIIGMPVKDVKQAFIVEKMKWIIRPAAK